MSLSSSDSSSDSVSMMVLLVVGGAGKGWEGRSFSTETSESLLALVTLLMSEYESSKLSFLLRFGAKERGEK